MDIQPVLCRVCRDPLTGHEDDGFDVCRWCDQGWRPSEDEGAVAPGDS